MMLKGKEAEVEHVENHNNQKPAEFLTTPIQISALLFMLWLTSLIVVVFMLLFVGKGQAVLAEVYLEGLSSGREESGRMEVTAWQFR